MPRLLALLRSLLAGILDVLRLALEDVEPFRGAVRQGDWKLIWRAMIPMSYDLYNLAEDPFEKNNLAAANPDKVKEMQERLNALGKEAAKPLALKWIAGTALAHGKPLIASEAAKAPPKADEHGHSITDEGFGEKEVHP